MIRLYGLDDHAMRYGWVDTHEMTFQRSPDYWTALVAHLASDVRHVLDDPPWDHIRWTVVDMNR